MKRYTTLLCTLLCLCGLLFGGCEDAPPSPEETPAVTVFAPGQTEYAVVFEATGSNAVIHCAEQICQIPQPKAEQRNDRWEEYAKEILIGETSREVTTEIKAVLDAAASEEAIHFIVAEQDGKILLMADNDIGYQYLENYLPETYLQNGVLSIPVGCRDLQTVTWDEYHASPYYAEILQREEEKARREKERAENIEKNKQKELAEYRELAKDFNTEDFGEKIVFPTDKYPTPEVQPSASHPRVLFTENTIDQVRENLTHEENAAAYKKYLASSEARVTGILPEKKEGEAHNIDTYVVSAIEAKAFRYAITGEELYGYQAIYAAKNLMLTVDAPRSPVNINVWRANGYAMYIVGCVYDWCYDLLTEECKTQFINGCVSLMGTQLKYQAPPRNMSPAYAQGAENELLRDWLTLGIAFYNEAPEIYQYVAGWILSESVRANDYLQASGNHWEGSMYGPARYICLMYAQTLLSRMTDGGYSAFSDDAKEVMYTLMHYIRPDRQVLRIGDVWSQDTANFYLSHYGIAAFYAGNHYKDPVLRQFAYEELNEFSYFGTGMYALSPIMQLALNDPSVGMKNPETISLSRVTKAPLPAVFARTTWEKEDADAAMVYMTMPQYHMISHGHSDCGSFQIYYKGILASESGTYSLDSAIHDPSYSDQTVSSNSILVYNPNLKDSERLKGTYSHLYSGGQSVMKDRLGAGDTLEEMLSYPRAHQSVSLGAAAKSDENGYQYAYLAGDMTEAYDPETVDEVSRYMFSAATEDEAYPLVFVTFDRITSDDASYRKSALIHTEEEPIITDDGFAIVTNTKRHNSGKLVIQTVMTDTEYTVIGGEGKRFWMYDADATVDAEVSPDSLAEYGWGRIEISPVQANKTDHIMTVMYVTDAKNDAAPIKATDISTETLAGTQILGKAMLFPKNEKLLTAEATFTLKEAGECYIAGVTAGTWTVTIGNDTKTIDVKEGENLLTFIAPAGAVTVQHK